MWRWQTLGFALDQLNLVDKYNVKNHNTVQLEIK